MSANETCPCCGAPVEGRSLDGWVVYQCGRTGDAIDEEGFNACDWAVSARAEGDRDAIERIVALLDRTARNSKDAAKLITVADAFTEAARVVWLEGH